MKIIRNISRVIVGLVFIFSGFVKGIDPLGSLYKFNDYFDALGLRFLMPISFFLGMILCTTEFITGIGLLTRYRIQFFSWLALLFMAVFLPLTLYIAIANPVKDCGCFGDALIMTNWQTFWKNIVLIIFTLIIFFNRKKFEPVYKPFTEWVVVGLITAGFVFFGIQNYRYLPVIDFRPYKLGTNIPEKMSIPADAPHDEYKTIFTYKNKKNGNLQEFDETNYPWQDTLGWEFVSYDNKLVKKGYEPPIHDFSITNSNGDIITDSVLGSNGYVFMLISYNVSKANQESMKKAQLIADYCKSDSMFRFFAITASTDAQIKRLRKKNNITYPLYSADEIMLKTVIRSNPGLVLLKNGTVIGQWPWRRMPSASEINKQILSKTLNQQRICHNKLVIALSITLLFLVLLLIKPAVNSICKKS